MSASMLNHSQRSLRKKQHLLKKIVGKSLKVSSVTLLLVMAVGGSVNVEASVRGQPMNTWEERIDFLNKSVVFSSLESLSIITAIGIFILEGRPEQKKLQRYMASAVIDLANRRETSSGRVEALQDLNEVGVSLRGQDLPKADLEAIQLQWVDMHEATLTGSYLTDANLIGADLYKAKLSEATLIKANLEQASIEFANLKAAKLQRANLRDCGLLGANLKQANLRAADLKNADLREADLSEAILNRADLRGADLKSANLMSADLTEADLRKAKNLEPDQIKHAKNWQLAKYDADFLAKLDSLSPEPEFVDSALYFG